jgi:2-aminobenzoate-CoA ligase
MDDRHLRQRQRFLKKVIGFDGTANHGRKWTGSRSTRTYVSGGEPRRDDVALLLLRHHRQAKATMHFHRDLLIIADGYARRCWVIPDGIFVG